MRISRLRVLTAALLVIVVAGCDGTPSSSQRYLVTTTTRPSAASSPGPSSIRPGSCGAGAPAGARCGTFSVPLDYADPGKGKIGLKVIVVPATDSGRRIGSVLVNPGGPGASGVQFVEDAMPIFTGLNQRFDIVGFDPRGTGDPDPVSCTDTAGLDHVVAVDPITDDPAERQDLLTTNQQFARQCQQRSGRLLPYVGTESVVRDLDGLRAAVGDDKLTYLGFSYGTSIGARYAAKFPSHIRAMTLDGDVDPSLNFFDLTAQQSVSLERNYQEFVNRCKALVPACPLGPDPDAVITKMLNDLDARPAPLADGRSVGRGEAFLAVVASMYSADAWPQDYGILADAARGKVAALQALADSYTGRTPGGFNHQLESNSAVNCADYAMPTDLAPYDAAAQQGAIRAPHFGLANAEGLLTCAYWPVHGSQSKPLSVHGAPKILLVGGTNDPATPYAWSQSLQKQIQGSVLLTRDGFGHVSYIASTCIQDKVDTYLTDLTAPVNGTICSN